LLRLLQLPDCICFSCCSPNCLSFSCCSLIASACDHTHAVQSIIYKGRTSCAGLVPPLDYPTSVAHRQTHTLKILMYGWLLDVTVSPCVCNSLSGFQSVDECCYLWSSPLVGPVNACGGRIVILPG